MSKFLTGNDLEEAITNIIWEANDILLILSPFIKLDDHFKRLFKRHINNPKLHIVIVFGKNDGNANKSLSRHDFDFFKDFMFVSVVYVPNLHAKYYGNEIEGIVTSINLYDYSFKNNIEYGIYSEVGLFNTVEKEAWNTSWNLAKSNEAVFIKRPVFQKSLLGKLFGKSFIKSDILLDNTNQFYGNGNKSKGVKEITTIEEFPNELSLQSSDEKKPSRADLVSEKITTNSKSNKKTTSKMHIGYCIRTGEEIPFNVEKPLSSDAFKTWSLYSNVDWPEAYCHYSGEESFGKTSFNKPILHKNWKKAKEKIL